MNAEISSFIDRYVKEIKNQNAAVFIGAGFSQSSGYVNWNTLLKDVAEYLELDSQKETDLIALAQYCCNKHCNKSMIKDVLCEEFSKNKKLHQNHKILARLPIFTYWTTNYDSLLEDALVDAHKVVDVKYRNQHFAVTKPCRDAIVYKMHGDKNTPTEAVITKDDYENYYRDHVPFITALSGDLASKTFLFIGFSFKDPNIDSIMSRVKIEYGKDNIKQHYNIMRRVNEKDDEYKGKPDEYKYDKRKQELFIDDLKRHNVYTLLIDDYSEITDILRRISKKMNTSNVFISGSAETYHPYEKEDALKFIQLLSKELIANNFNIISGFGWGVGSAVIMGALPEIEKLQRSRYEDRLLLRPFPQGIEDKEEREHMQKKYREDMISCAGISLFLFGNRAPKPGEEDYGKTNYINAPGVRKEFVVAKEKHHLLVPIGCTGYMASEIWNEIYNNFDEYYCVISGDAKDKEVLKEAFCRLNLRIDNATLVQNIIAFIKLFDYKKYAPI